MSVSTTKFIQQYESQLFAMIRRRVRHEAEAYDVLQDVYEEFVAAADLELPIEAVGAWLFRVAQKKIIDLFRRNKVRKDYQESIDAPKLLETGPTPEDELVRSFLRKQILDALELLPPEQLDVFVKHELEGKSFEEIASETGVNINTLLARKRYAVRFLREYLKEVYDEL